MSNSIKDKIIGLKELRENTENYISQVGKGKSFIVVKKSKPVFTISPVDKLGDEGIRETVVDFNEIKRGGVDARLVLESLKRLGKKE
jgi:prevent-host-death family protein